MVEDNRDAAETLAAMLNLLGYDAHVAFSGTEALERAAVELPHAILLDIGMPGLNGFEVARGVKGEACGVKRGA